MFELSVRKSRWKPVIAVGALLVVARAAVAEPPAVSLSPEQEVMARRLDGMLIAPCCFANTAAEHRSPLSDRVREEVRELIAGGASEEQILDAFVAKYGERILAAPQPRGFNRLAYVLPFLALAAGLALIGLTLHRHRPHREEPGELPPPPPDALRARLEAELARFDETR